MLPIATVTKCVFNAWTTMKGGFGFVSCWIKKSLKSVSASFTGSHLPREEGALRVSEEQTVTHQTEDPGI